MSEKVITRFAPSPTGYLHIGGARTALFNWLYARAKGGKVLLRIEDTDQARSTKGAILAILDGLRWLDLEWDGEPLYQMTRAERHREVAEQLLAEGKAYSCYASPEELAAMRERARAEGRAPGYDGTWRDRDHREAPPGIAPTIRFKAPREGETVIKDRVQGRVVFANKDLDDLVILRSDGTPTYNLSVVVDDHDMDITHVIRGDDHLTNAARQTQIFKALGWQTPIYAHVPLIHGPDGAKLSKRHGALGVEAYRAMGYLPAALRNYLVRLGWSHGDAEIMSTDEMIQWFDLDAIGRSAARFDFAKLENLNGHYLRVTPDIEIVQRLKALVPELPDGVALGERIDADGWQKLERAMPGLKERAKTLVELLDSASFLFAKRPLTMDEQAAKLLDAAGREMLAALLPRLEDVSPWTLEALEASVRSFADETGRKLGKAAQPLRAALTGRSASPGIFEVLEVLGRDESLARIRDQAHAGNSA
ncbi:MAG TPA: glutamate--tRNA ligase [Rhizobiales bacterium]|jgi:glutamyl-tRNA synthetase|nr:glutamate--tRNA ligase [Hyphomicrobiales bacterium]HAN63127.1 glutamate--tRNA ligase [Hyphomicrobiales bacterium]HBH41523.1 glutamate--tRNA ligase [Hyphomicrobiales bacterium]